MLNRRRGMTTKGAVTNGRTNQHGPKGFSSRGLSPRIVSIVLGLIIVYVIVARDQPDASLSMIMDSVSDRVLDMYSPSTASTPASTGEGIPRFPVDAETAQGQGAQEPVLLEGWTLPHGGWSKEGLVSRVGEFPQYLKDSTVQPLKTKGNALCRLPVKILVQLLDKHDLLFFTNNKENDAFMKALPMPLSPRVVEHINGFQVFSVMSRHKSHSFHRHGESWLGQIEGRRQWWFLPPNTDPPPPRVNACGYLTGDSDLPVGATTIMQEPGTVMWFPTDWYHATCALDDWTLGVGAQQGRTIRQNFDKLDSKAAVIMTTEQIETTVHECLGDKSFAVNHAKPSSSKAAAVAQKKGKRKKKKQGDEKWQWFDGDLNAYYNSLEKDHNRDPTNLSDYAIHRWLGPSKSTEQQYLLLNEAAMNYMDPSNLEDPVYVLDGGCGLGSGLMWMELQHPTWKLEGYTLSEDQYSFIEKLPKHNFKVHLQSYDDLEPRSKYDFIYSIEALIHSPNATRTMEIWASHLNPGGVMAILDDFVVKEEDKDIDDMKEFAKSWLANSLFSTKELQEAAKGMGLEVVQNRFLVEEFDIISLNYRNQKPDIHPFGGRVHQGWLGSKWRQRLTVEKRLDYNLLVLKKASTNAESTAKRETTRRMTTTDDTACEAAPVRTNKDGPAADYTFITPQLMSGRGKDGGEKIACISGWYCCNKGTEWWDQLDKGRTDNTAFLKLDRQLFGHYIDSFTNHLNAHFANYPSGVRGRFLDIGGTGSTASGMTQVTSKFQHFAGPLEYWKLDSDPAANGLERTLFCDIEDCPSAETCSFDITFSHTVLEHATRPWLAFDTVARITKKGGLTMHLVPFSYQYHATPDDNYRFSHKALISLLEDRGFEVLEVGYDICTKPENMRERIDEHYDTIWLTYVIGRKL